MEIGSILRRHRALARLGPEAFDRVVRTASLMRLRRGDALWRAGDPAGGFVVVGVGLVKSMLPGGGTRDLVLGLAGPGEAVGDLAVLSGDTHDADAFAFTETVAVVRVERGPVVAALETAGAAPLELARGFADQARIANRRMALFTASAEERLAATLTELGERFGDEMDDGSTLIPLRLTRAELASLVGTTVETTIRTLSRWSREGLVSTGEGRLTLHDAKALALRSMMPSPAVGRG